MNPCFQRPKAPDAAGTIPRFLGRNLLCALGKVYFVSLTEKLFALVTSQGHIHLHVLPCGAYLVFLAAQRPSEDS